MKILYNAAIYLYTLLIHIAANFNDKASKMVSGRKGVFEFLESKIDKNAQYIWFHVASLGEFEQGRPIIERIKKEHPEYKILLTFFSPSGYEVRKDYKEADVVCYLPMDTASNAKRFMDICQPKISVFVKYEFWLNYLNELKERKVPTFIVSAIFRKEQTFFKWYGGWYRDCLQTFEHLYVQDEESVELLKSINVTNVSVAGDTRFDRVAAICKQAKDLPLVEAFKQGKKPILVAGSSWPKDEDLLLDYFNTHQYKIILAPHEVHEAHINEIISKLKLSYVRYTKATAEEAAKADCLIIDCIGLLSSIYRYGELAYIGGGFGVGIHNVLEPAVYGMPVIFGPNYKRFREAVEMSKAGAAFPIEEGAQLNQTLDILLDESTGRLAETSAIARKFVESNCGATDIIMKGMFSK